METSALEVAKSGIKVDGDTVLPMRLSKAARTQLASWIHHQVQQGHSDEAIREMLRGTSDQTVNTNAKLLGEATGSAELLENTIPELEQELDSGEWDSAITELLEAERLGKERKGALSALEERAVVASDRAELQATLPELEQELATGTLDDRVERLVSVEEEHSDRKGAKAMLAERIRLVKAAEVLEGTLEDLEAWLATNPPSDELAFVHEAERKGKKRVGAEELFNEHGRA